ncbi:precorrin-6A reductase [Candidatus Contubernalis alkaliaceticus]|uniref:precorrin-6A reductase n=1 Tax=Candidatus Contubernalis alkaliaceticus TaxID=338645 RepID=UPI001F4C4836|nr:precorrin-6A reductase [Candidatus Contubernalis alkalaceticus]UNC92495.1 precorrin-6A reductase [Candidatus Contubernalis alkalaceticus]
MLLLIAGTTEGRVLFHRLKGTGLKLIATSLTDYGINLLNGEGDSNFEAVKGSLDKTGLSQLIEEKSITKIIDASHPFALEISKHAMDAAREQGVVYLRYERSPLILPENNLIKRTDGFQQAAEEAVGFGRVIFLTIGVRNLQPFVSTAEKQEKNIVARVLPLESSLKACRENGLQPSQIVALQGTGSKDLNKELFKFYQASVLVTKDGGTTGGTLTKIEAALELNIPVIFIQRPNLDYGKNVYHQMNKLIEQIINNEK